MIIFILISVEIFLLLLDKTFQNLLFYLHRVCCFAAVIMAITGRAKNIFQLLLGQGIIIPAHASHRFNANEKFKMIATVIKSGYED